MGRSFDGKLYLKILASTVVLIFNQFIHFSLTS